MAAGDLGISLKLPRFPPLRQRWKFVFLVVNFACSWGFFLACFNRDWRPGSTISATGAGLVKQGPAAARKEENQLLKSVHVVNFSAAMIDCTSAPRPKNRFRRGIRRAGVKKWSPKAVCSGRPFNRLG